MRAALFFVPAQHHPLTRAAAVWLMRDAYTRGTVPPARDDRLSTAEMRELTAEPRRYGFHATLKAPFRLADGIDLGDVKAAAEALARHTEAWPLPRLEIERLGPFFALVPSGPDPRLQAFAAEVVSLFDRFRAPLMSGEMARRRPENLSPSQLENLHRWGYPHVLDDFQFHMTLTGPVPAEKQAAVADVLERRFAPLLRTPVALDALAIFVEPESGAEFHVEARYPFAG